MESLEIEIVLTYVDKLCSARLALRESPQDERTWQILHARVTEVRADLIRCLRHIDAR
jgi:hypothetical protein